MVCTWTSDQNQIVLEVPDTNGNTKATSDSDRCSWAQLLREMEEAGHTDPTINSHDLLSPVTDGGKRLLCHCLWSEIYAIICRAINCKWVLVRSSALHHKAEAHPHLFQLCFHHLRLQVHKLCQCIHCRGPWSWCKYWFFCGFATKSTNFIW